MSWTIIYYAIIYSLICLTFGCVASSIRVFKGPSPEDRAWALDAIYINCMLIIVILGMLFKSSWYYEVAFLMALLGFVGTVALAKFLLRGEVIEP